MQRMVRPPFLDETRNKNFIGNESVGHRQEIGTHECIINHDFPLINLGFLRSKNDLIYIAVQQQNELTRRPGKIEVADLFF